MAAVAPDTIRAAFASWVPQISQKVAPGELYRTQHNRAQHATWKPDGPFTSV